MSDPLPLSFDVSGNRPMTSVPIPPLIYYPKKAVNESSVEMLHHFNRNDQMQPTSLHAAANNHLTSLTSCAPYKNSVWTINLNSNILSLDVSQCPNLYVTNPNTNEPKTTDTFYQPLQKNESINNKNINNKSFSELPKHATLDDIKIPPKKCKRIKTTLAKLNEPNESMANKTDETIVDVDSSYVSKGTDYACLICDISFWTEELLNTHLEGTDFRCRVCIAEFINHSELKSHFLKHRIIRCVVCKKAFVCKEDLYNHRRSSPSCNSKFECEICKNMFSSKISVRKHKQTVHPRRKHSFNCVVCDKMFLTQFQLNAHQNKCHIAYENIECKMCSSSLLGPDRLKLHTLAHLKKREICPFTCSICGKVLNFKKTLEIHEKSHNVVKEKIVCKVCGKSCTGTLELSHHMAFCHTSVNKVKCSMCNKEFKTKGSMRAHVNNMHFEKKKYTPAVCEICGKTLKNKEQLRTHLLIHSSVRQFKCGICNATFKQLVALRTHSRIHSNICKYNCSDCGKSFKWKQTFDKHKNKCKEPQNN